MKMHPHPKHPTISHECCLNFQTLIDAMHTGVGITPSIEDHLDTMGTESGNHTYQYHLGSLSSVTGVQT